MANRFNNLDDLIINQGYMSQRTKSPRRMNQQQFFENEMAMYGGNVIKLNSGRDMSPNKIMAKNKPLVSNNNVNQLLQYGASKINHNQQQPQQYNTLQNHNQNLLHPSIQNNIQQQHPFANNNNLRLNNTNHVRSPRSQQYDISQQLNNRVCENHSNKKAQFMTQTDGQIIYYCQTCAAKLAAQQFQVIKLPVGNFAIGNGNMMGVNADFRQMPSGSNGMKSTKNNNNMSKPPITLQRRNRTIPNIPKYKSNPVYQSIIQFLKQIYTVQQCHYETHSQLQQIDQHYQHQITMVDQFYNQLIQILQKMHQDHVTDIQRQYKKHSQMKDIYINEIYQNLETIQQIVNDLDENFQTVVNKITNEDINFFNQALQKNRSNIRFFCNQIQQQKEMLSEVIDYKEERLLQMVEEYEKCLIGLWEEKKENNSRVNANGIGNGKMTFGPGNNIYKESQGAGLKHQNNANLNNNFNLNNILQPNNRQENPQYKQQEQKKLNNILQIHQNQQKSALTRDFEGKGACRQIFQDDEEESIAQQVSPKFKNI